MADLTARLQEIEDLITANSQQLYARLGETNAKLDTVIDLLGDTPSGATTLADVVAAIEAGNLVLDDIKTRTGAAAIYLDTITLKTSSTAADTTAILAQLQAMRAAIAPEGEALPLETRSSIVWSLYRIMDAIQPAWPRETSIPLQPAIDLIYNLLQPVPAAITTIRTSLGVIPPSGGGTVLEYLSMIDGMPAALYQMIGTIIDLLGPYAEGDAESVRALLACICDTARSQLPISPIDPANEDYCADPYTSTGMWLGAFSFVGGTDIVVAVWPDPPPSGLFFGGFLGIGTDYTELNSNDWSRWRVFVESTDEQYADGPWSGAARYPTNVWRQLEGTGPKAFSVSNRAGIKVYLCYVSEFDLEPGDCVTVQSNMEFQGHRAYLLPEGLPDDYTVNAADNFYRYTAEGDYAGGPHMAGVPIAVLDLTFNGGRLLRFGSGMGDPVVNITICAPEEV